LDNWFFYPYYPIKNHVVNPDNPARQSCQLRSVIFQQWVFNSGLSAIYQLLVSKTVLLSQMEQPQESSP
jgi:hypothetical protein